MTQEIVTNNVDEKRVEEHEKRHKILLTTLRPFLYQLLKLKKVLMVLPIIKSIEPV
jgi:hypothetical protein